MKDLNENVLRLEREHMRAYENWKADPNTITRATLMVAYTSWQLAAAHVEQFAHMPTYQDGFGQMWVQ